MDRRPPAPPLLRGFRPGLLGDVIALQARNYAEVWGLPTAGGRRAPSPSTAAIPAPATACYTSAGSSWATAREVGESAARSSTRRSRFSRASGRPGVYLWTFAGLEAARRLYDDAGFALAEERSGETWGTRVTEQRFVLPLP